jgi:hypothetical protein
MSNQSVSSRSVTGGLEEESPLQFDLFAEFAIPLQTMSEQSFDVNYLFGTPVADAPLEFVALPAEEVPVSSVHTVDYLDDLFPFTDAPGYLADLFAPSEERVVVVDSTTRFESGGTLQMFRGELVFPFELQSESGPGVACVLACARPPLIDQSVVYSADSAVDPGYSWILFFGSAYHHRLRGNYPPCVSIADLLRLARHHVKWLQGVHPVTLAIDVDSRLYHVRVDRVRGRPPSKFVWALSRVRRDMFPCGKSAITCVRRHGCDS